MATSKFATISKLFIGDYEFVLNAYQRDTLSINSHPVVSIIIHLGPFTPECHVFASAQRALKFWMGMSTNRDSNGGDHAHSFEWTGTQWVEIL